MHTVSFVKHLYYSYLGRLYAFAFFSQRRTFLGIHRSSWLRLLTLALFVASLILRWGIVANIVTFLLWVTVGLIYRVLTVVYI